MSVHRRLSAAAVLDLVRETGSATEVARRLGVSKQAVGYYTRKAGISPRAIARAMRPPRPAPLCPECGMIVSGEGRRCLRCSKKNLKGLPGYGRVDIKGHRFGRLVAVEATPYRKDGYVLWRCRCDCGREVYAGVGKLRSGNTRSCGCLQREAAAALGRRGR
jgi:hypothetical protein